MFQRLSIFCVLAFLLVTAPTRPILRAQEPTPAIPGMTAGSHALVNNLGGKALLMVSSPDNAGAALANLPSGALVTITYGPLNTKTLSWWRIRTDWGEGWVLTNLKLDNKALDSLIPATDDAFKKALSDYTKLIDNKPDSAAYAGRGLVHYGHQDNEAALADFDRAFILDNKSEPAYFYRGLVHQSRKEYAEALADFTRAAELDSTEPAYLYARCTAHLGKGEFQAAVDDCTRVITLKPKFAAAYNNRGGAYRALGDVAAALSDYTAAVKIDPYYARAYYNRALMYRTQGKSDLAVADYKRSLELDPANVDAYWLLGDAYAALGRKVEALQAYKRYQTNAASPDPAVESRIQELEAALKATPVATARR